jgi:hypothetical protein
MDNLLKDHRHPHLCENEGWATRRGDNSMLDTMNTKVLSWMRQAPGTPTVLVSLNFTAEPQTVDLAGPEIGAKWKLQTLLKSPGGSDPSGPNHNPSRFDKGHPGSTRPKISSILSLFLRPLTRTCVMLSGQQRRLQDGHSKRTHGGV